MIAPLPARGEPFRYPAGAFRRLSHLARGPASTLSGFRARVLEECPVAAPAPSRRSGRGGGGGRSCGRRPRPAGSWIWSPNDMAARLDPPGPRGRDQRPPGPLLDLNIGTAAPPCVKPSWPRGTETRDSHQVRRPSSIDATSYRQGPAPAGPLRITSHCHHGRQAATARIAVRTHARRDSSDR